MSEHQNTQCCRVNIRRGLLATASTFVLLGYFDVYAVPAARAEDQSPIWVELGGQFERLDGDHTVFAPPFMAHTPAADLAPMIDAQAPSPFSIGGDAKITFNPSNTNWVFSVSAIYGRSSKAQHLNRQTQVPYVQRIILGGQVLYQPGLDLLGDGQSNFKDTHAILDFQAGKDFGLGLFGSGGISVVSAGVRFAQFTSRANVSLHARPHYTFGAEHKSTYVSNYYGVNRYRRYKAYDHFRNTYAATMQATRNSHAIGPSISWNAGTPLLKDAQGMAVTLDWGVNAAILFGRQQAKVHHQTSGSYFRHTGGYSNRLGDPPHHTSGSYAHGPYNRTASHTVTIPNFGGFAGMSLKFPNAKISLGYRGDFFLGAMDTGIDAAKRTTIGFYGPFATVSIGLGG